MTATSCRVATRKREPSVLKVGIDAFCAQEDRQTGGRTWNECLDYLVVDHPGAGRGGSSLAGAPDADTSNQWRTTVLIVTTPRHASELGSGATVLGLGGRLHGSGALKVEVIRQRRPAGLRMFPVSGSRTPRLGSPSAAWCNHVQAPVRDRGGHPPRRYRTSSRSARSVPSCNSA